MQYRTQSLIRISIVSILILSGFSSLSCARKSATEKSGSSTPSNSYRPPAPEPSPIDAKANQFDLRLLEGGNAKLNELVGNKKVVLVNFWATWCTPCLREIPDLIALQRQFKDKGFEVVGLTVEDPDSDLESVRDFTRKHMINYKIGFSPQDMFMIFNGTDPRGVIPQTFIFDRNGKLVDRVRGFRRNFRQWVEGAVNHALNNS